MTLYNNWAYVLESDFQLFDWIFLVTTTLRYQPAVDRGYRRDNYPRRDLSQPDGTSSGTNFGLGVGSYCNSSTNYSYMDNIGFFAHIQPYPGSTHTITHGCIRDRVGLK